MTTERPALLAVDRGTATTSAALAGRVGGRWRLLGTAALPASVTVDALETLLVERLRAVDPALANAILPASAAGPERLEVRTAPPPLLAIVACSARAAGPLVAAATVTGWRTRVLALDDADPLAVIRALLDPTVAAVLAGAGSPPSGDERSGLPRLGTLIGAALARRPDLTLVLAGGAAEQAGTIATLAGEARPGRTHLLLPGVEPEPVDPAAALEARLGTVRAPEDDGRRALGRAAGTLAELLDRRVEVLEIGAGAGSRFVARDGGVAGATVAGAALVPDDLSPAIVDGVLAWSTMAIDRLRLADRLRELRFAPWTDAPGEGAIIRLAAARAALDRLIEATPALGRAAVPDLLVAAGGAFQSAPGPAIALALADAVRRPGATNLALDHGRLLAPLGSLADEDRRRHLIADLRDDLLAPLGSLVMPAGLRMGRSVGRLVVHAAAGPTEAELVPGGLQLVDLPPGEHAVVEFRFRDPVALGGFGRRFAVDVGGGLGGLLVDLRDIPLRLPDRLDRRREVLAAWQDVLWSGSDA